MNNTAYTALGQGTLRVEGGEMEVAVVNMPPGEGRRTLWVLGELVTYKVSSQMTGGAHAMFEVATRAGAGASPHVQHREDECFYVLEGEYEFLVESRTSRVRAGSLLYIPKGTLHGHESVGERAGRMLITQTPGGLYERFFEEVGKPVGGKAELLILKDESEVANIAAIAAKYGIEIPLPVAQHGRA
jgi:mannose-6-phosphate isomerase-like protein (cupin superfamily)